MEELETSGTMSPYNPWLTVTLTGEPPVRISKDEWEILSSAEFKKAGKLTRLTVRHHADGRVIVYGVYQAGGFGLRGGEVIGPDESVVEAIERVGGWMAQRVHDGGHFALAVHQCIANLPARDV